MGPTCDLYGLPCGPIMGFLYGAMLILSAGPNEDLHRQPAVVQRGTHVGSKQVQYGLSHLESSFVGYIGY